MKKGLKVLCLMMMCLFAQEVRAQLPPLHYTYTPDGYSPQESSQTYRATAYYESQGEYVKLPIQVTVTTVEYYGGRDQMVQVSAYYTNYGYGGNWTSCQARVQQCQHGYWNSNNRLEQSFMYKACIGMTWVYFDL